ncbi:DUF1439 domain-containing protein [uncultured Microscilla sp.]|uniref:DUF1439 domain-containing protein n=1 Tax=uncultured Microscilla sp. TaxID=432653 RepID=UPI002620697C|nr:DUF1439 domain-containing protein [uncultured Microscilla sp.]
MKNSCWLAFLIVFCLSACNKSPVVIDISQEQIQKALDKKFPYQKNAIIAKVAFTDPKVSISANKIFVEMSFGGNAWKKSIQGQVGVVGRVAYKQDKKAFYLKEFDILKIDAGNVKEVEKQRLVKVFKKAMVVYLTSFPVYKLKKKDYKQNIARMLLKDLKTTGDKLVVTLSF